MFVINFPYNVGFREPYGLSPNIISKTILEQALNFDKVATQV